MRALITGASSGIGRDMALELGRMGYDLDLVARSREPLEVLRDTIDTQVEIHVLDLSQADACFALYDRVRAKSFDILINNAAFGYFGPFLETELETELNLIDLNIRSVHILSKLFLRDFNQAGRGMIMNVASIAAYLPGPLMSSYYASKAYVLSHTRAIAEELRRSRSPVRVCVLCPGPVKTNFNRRAGARFRSVGLESRAVAVYALKHMFRGRQVIIPGWTIRLARFVIRLVPDAWLLRLIYAVQKTKDPALT
jgi:hypothetical protein